MNLDQLIFDVQERQERIRSEVEQERLLVEFRDQNPDPVLLWVASGLRWAADHLDRPQGASAQLG
jgi:hypothetical protein